MTAGTRKFAGPDGLIISAMLDHDDEQRPALTIIGWFADRTRVEVTYSWGDETHHNGLPVEVWWRNHAALADSWSGHRDRPVRPGRAALGHRHTEAASVTAPADLCPRYPEETLTMTAFTPSTELELVADQITQTIYSAPFAQASRRQQELALTCARKILASLPLLPTKNPSMLQDGLGVALCGQDATNG